MKKALTLIMAGAAIVLAGCKKDHLTGSGSIVTEERNIANFTGIRTMGATEVHISQGTAFKVQVKEYGNLLPYFKTSIHGSVLELGFQNNTSIKNSRAEVFITMPVLHSLKTEGSGNIIAEGIFPFANILDAAITGSGNITVENGTVNTFNSYIGGSGDVYAFGVIAAEAAIFTEGSGNVEITANNKLNAKIRGSGNVYYKGSPVITTSINGSGQVIPR